MPIYSHVGVRVEVRKNRATGEWVVNPRRFGFGSVRAKTFPAAIVLADAYARELSWIAA